METAHNSVDKSRTNVVTWLFNPFYYIAGSKAMAIGIVVILITGYIGSFTNSHCDGIVDFHTGIPAPMWVFLSGGLINWLIIGTLLFFGGMILSPSSFRIIDVFGTRALARFPYFLTAAVTLLPGFGNFSEQLKSSIPDLVKDQIALGDIVANNMTESIVFLIAIIISLLMGAYMVFLMYRAFTISCNVGGGKAVGAFIAILIIGEILSKFIFYYV